MTDSDTNAAIQALLRPNIRSLTPYSSARDDFGGDAEVWLDANENATSPLGLQGMNRYPSTRHQELRETLSHIYGVADSDIFAGHGSDEAIDLLMRAFCTPGEHRVLSLAPSYGMYQVSATINDLSYDEVQLAPDFTIDLDALIHALTPSTRITCICSPNNPSGNTFSSAAIERLLNSFDGLVVVDEAYIDFAPEDSVLSLHPKYSRLVILRTFSKAWGLAGLRLGTAIAHPAVIRALYAIKPPYNLNNPTLDISDQLVEKQQQVRERVKEIIDERERMAIELDKLNFVQQVYPSKANFLLVQVTKAQAVYKHLLRHGIVVRDRSRLPGCENCLRFTIGSYEENERLLNALSLFTP